MRNRVFIVMLSVIAVCAPLYAQETKAPIKEIQADVKLGSLLFLALFDLELALSYRFRHSEHIWYGVQMGSHLLSSIGQGKSNSNHELYSLSGVILRQSIYRYGYLSSMIGLGLVWLRYNENYDDCDENTWFNFFGSSSCDDWTPPPDRWSNHLGLSIPVSLQFGIRIYAIKVGLSLNGGLMLFRTALAERLTPIQLGASVGYLW